MMGAVREESLIEERVVEATAVHRSSSNRAYRLDSASSSRGRLSARGVVTATALLCLALFALGIHVAQRSFLHKQSTSSLQSAENEGMPALSDNVAAQGRRPDAVVSSVRPDSVSIVPTIKEQESRIQDLSEILSGSYKKLQGTLERNKMLRKERTHVVETALTLVSEDRVLDLLRARERQPRSSEDERDALKNAIKLMRAYGEDADGRTLKKILTDQKQVLRRLETLGDQLEKVVLDKGGNAGLLLCKQYRSVSKSLNSVVSNLATRKKEWNLSVGLENEVTGLTKTLTKFLNRHFYLIEAQEKQRTTSGANIDHRSVERKRELEAVMKSTGALVDRLRLSQAQDLAQKFYELGRITGKMASHIIQFKTRLLELSPEERRGLHIIADEGGHIFKTWEQSLQEEMKVRKPGVLDYAVNSIPLGLSKRLNDKLLEFEAKRAELISQMEEQFYVRGLDETDEEKRQLKPVKKELQAAIQRVEQSLKSDDRWAFMEKGLQLSVVNFSPAGYPFFLVENFNRIDASDDVPGTDVMFEFKGLAGADDGLIVLNVQPADAELRDELGTLQMKVPMTLPPGYEEAVGRSGVHVVVPEEGYALPKLARGESLKKFSKRTGITGDQYAGYLVDRNDSPNEDKEHMTFWQVEFSSPAVVDLRDIHEKGRHSISMQARVYIAHSFLRSVAHIHQYGYVHNSLSSKCVGIAEDGSVSVKLLGLNRPGAMRNGFGYGYIPPESAQAFWEEGKATGNYVTDSWAVGVVLYLIFSNGVIPFHDTDSSFFTKLVGMKTFESVWRMTNIESAAPQLRRYGVPDVWVNAISLLLERTGKRRPTVLQVLQAYPQLGWGPLQALKEDKMQ